MSRRDDTISMRHMLDHAREACAMVERRDRSDLDSDRMLQLALTRLIEIIGEAASRVSVTTREKFPELPWGEIVGMRHRLIHGYDVVELNILWDTVQIDLPPLIEQLERILGTH
ncbi:MAG: hypothetical protein Kow0063_22120 [Anaerolineae bacterium]